jgi:antirestriction protein ArdC
MDIINMPFRHQFNNASYYETLFHEYSHWAEHPDRLNWDRDDDQNSYALGELVAEMTSCFVCSELGIPLSEGIENHAAYVSNWLKSLKNDPSFIFKAATQASKAADYLLSFRSSPVESQLLPA